jgi:hypothetical protein
MPLYTPPVSLSAALAHTGTTVGFYGATPVTRASAYTQTNSTAARTHAATALSENVTVTLLTDTPALFNSTNAAINEVKKLVNAIVDDLQAVGISQ